LRKSSGGFSRCINLVLSAAGLAALVMAVAFIPARASLSAVQAQAQNAPADVTGFQYDVVSVKPSGPGSNASGRRGTMNTPDGYTATSIEPVIFIETAYGILNLEQLEGAPGWVSSEKYDVEAKMDGSVADAFQKLSTDDRKLARQHMMQALLADRFKLVVHRETKELATYTLVIGKNGPKILQAKPGDTYPGGFKLPDGRPATGGVMMQASAAGVTWRGQAVPMTQLVQLFSREVKRIVVDKTGLTGNFDFSMQFMPEAMAMQTASGGAPGGASPLPVSDPGGPDLFTAIQEQLGLKLEATKTGIEVIVIDHVERPSGN
jgi:uncharacterized protein (TIGR03435 family)